MEDIWLAYFNGQIDIQEVEKRIDEGADINEELNDAGWTPLIFSIFVGDQENYELTKLLIEKGVNIEAKDKNGKTPLMHSSEYGILEMIKILVEKGANIESKGKHDCNALYWASRNGRFEVVKFLLEKGADPDSVMKDSGMKTLIINNFDDDKKEEINKIIEKDYQSRRMMVKPHRR